MQTGTEAHSRRDYRCIQTSGMADEQTDDRLGRQVAHKIRTGTIDLDTQFHIQTDSNLIDTAVDKTVVEDSKALTDHNYDGQATAHRISVLSRRIFFSLVWEQLDLIISFYQIPPQMVHEELTSFELTLRR